MTVLGLRACAKELGISHVRLLALVHEKRVPRNADGTFDVDAVRGAFERTKDPSQRSRMGQPPASATEAAPAKAESARESPRPEPEERRSQQPGFNDVRTLREAVRLKLDRLDLDARQRTLMPVSEVERQARETAHQVREGMLAIPDRVASLVAAELDASKVHDILSGEIRKALIAVSDQVSSIQ